MPERPIAIMPKLYDAIVWYARKLGKYPRSYRYNIGERIMQGLLNVLELVLESQYTAGAKSSLLRRANMELEKVRFLIRISKDLQCISLDEYENAAGLLVELGRMIGGWEKHSRGREKEHA